MRAAGGERHISVSARRITLGLFLVRLAASPAWLEASQVLWTRTIDGSPPSPDAGFSDIATDQWGNIYATGDVIGVGYDILIASYSSNGQLRWSLTVDAGLNQNEFGIAIAVDSGGTLFVTGYVYPDASGVNQSWLACIAPGGSILWSRTWQPVSGWSSYGMDLEVNGSTIFLATLNYDPNAGVWPAVFYAFDLQGIPTASTSFVQSGQGDPSSSNPRFKVLKVAVGSDGEPYWLYRKDPPVRRVWILKTGRGLDVVWTKSISGRDELALSKFSDGILAATSECLDCPGACCGPCGDLSKLEAWLHHLGPDGSLRWTMPYLAPGTSHTLVFDLAADSAGGFVAAGHAGYGIMNSWAWVAKFDANRNVEWSRSVPGARWYNEVACVHADYGNGVALAPGGRVVLAGMLDQGFSGNSFDAFVTVLGPGAPGSSLPPVSDPPVGPGIRISASGGRMPFRQSAGENLVIRVPVSTAGRVVIAVYSLLWERVLTIHDGSAAADVTARWNGRGSGGAFVAPGAYLIRVEAPGLGVVTRRVAVGR